MIPQANITAWRAHAPWADDAQVEQDLVLTRALIAIFSDQKLAASVALRGGTALQKLFIQHPCRYSEDIDLVQMDPGPSAPFSTSAERFWTRGLEDQSAPTPWATSPWSIGFNQRFLPSARCVSRLK